MRHLLPISKHCVSCHVLLLRLLILLFPNALRFLVMNVSKTSSTPQACRLPPSSFELAKVGPFLLRRRKRYTYNVTAVYKNEKKREEGENFCLGFLFVEAFSSRCYDDTLFEKSNFCPKIQVRQNPNIFTRFSPKFF